MTRRWFPGLPGLTVRRLAACGLVVSGRAYRQQGRSQPTNRTRPLCRSVTVLEYTNSSRAPAAAARQCLLCARMMRALWLLCTHMKQALWLLCAHMLRRLLRACVVQMDLLGLAFWSAPALEAQHPVPEVRFLGRRVHCLLPALWQGHPQARAEPITQHLAVQTSADEDYLIQYRLILCPGLLRGPVTDGLMHPLEDKLLVGMAMHSENALASEDVFGLLCEEVTHEHVEAVFVQLPFAGDAHTADI
mmetsp:Transcript_18761/g.31983  ORF Transcript_18761/g.31983 Transcript_18761/m.31983 type:complete len:247 (+) Transcript_18761:436-1176(+)